MVRDETYDFGLAPGERFEPAEDGDEPFDLAQPHVMTALGPIDPDDLGVALCHTRAVRGSLDAEATRSLAELDAAFNAGLRAIVAMTPVADHRDAADLFWIAQRSLAHLILATGRRRDAQTAPSGAEPSIDEIAARYLRDLTEGIDGTPVKAGLIAAETSQNRFTPAEDRVLRAAAWAHLVTGAPIATVAECGSTALEQIAVLRAEGVDPRSVIVGQMEPALDEEDLRRILDGGGFVLADPIDDTADASDEDRAATIKRLVSAGFADRLLLSGDGFGWSSLVEVFPLVLMEAGLDAPTVRRLFVDNPARALTMSR